MAKTIHARFHLFTALSDHSHDPDERFQIAVIDFGRLYGPGQVKTMPVDL